MYYLIVNLFFSEIDDLKPIVEEHDPDAGKNHLELDQLGRVLQAMSEQVQG